MRVPVALCPQYHLALPVLFCFVCFNFSHFDMYVAVPGILIDLSVRFFFKIYFIDFLQRGRERDRELETPMREKHRSAASCTSPTGDVPATQVHALDRNRTWDLSVRKPTLYPLSQTSFGECQIFLNELCGLLLYYNFL
uniref:Uncharacterized protein n=1 Tax=Myotis myotis TaxID=51298 RepID=A0A7J7U5D9_MYOMY|nr:hypothetical protein mMyoMyo1_008825 [Myotis myotis]